MTRRRLNADGTLENLSWSYFGDGDPDEAYRREHEWLEEHNRKARAEWEKLSPEEQERRIAQHAAENWR